MVILLVILVTLSSIRGNKFPKTERMRLHGQTGQLTVTGGGSFAGILAATTFMV